MDDGETNGTEAARDPRWGFCEAYGCPLPGTVGRAGKWLCFCHFEADAGVSDDVTGIIRRHFAVYRSVADVRRGIVSERWPSVWREVQQRLIESGHADLLPDQCDASPYRPGRPVVQQWLARLERVLLDAARTGLHEQTAQARAINVAARRPLPSSRECVTRMRTTLAPLAKRAPSAHWAFDLLNGIAAHRGLTPPPETVRIALEAIRSPAGRAYVANGTDEQRGRWHAALETLGGAVADLMPSRVPGADDEEPQDERPQVTS